MTATDQYGLPLSTDSSAAADAYVEGLELALRLDPGAPGRFAASLEQDPEFAMPRAALALQFQNHPDPAAAVGLALFASKHVRMATRREQQHVEVVRRVAVRDWAGAVALASAHLVEHPRDALVLWQLLRVHGYSGDPDRKARSADELDRRATDFGDDPWYLGIHGFALSESGRLDEAQHLAERGLRLAPDHVLPAHATSHIAYERRDDKGGRAFLRDWLAANSGGLIGGHLVWHLTLTDLALGDADVALTRYRSDVSVQHLPDGASLLWRLHLRGHDVGDDMRAIVDEPLSAGLNATFVQAHQAALFCALGDGAALDRLMRGHREDGLPARRVFAAWVAALRSIVDGRWAEAVAPLERVCAEVRVLGGSNEQHDFFHETLAAARRRLPA